MSDFSDIMKNKFGFTLDQLLDYRDLLLSAISNNKRNTRWGLETYCDMEKIRVAIVIIVYRYRTQN